MYKLQVNLQNNIGDSIPASAGADTFTYMVTITSITPNTGSYNGGTLVTITGMNFNPAAQETLVYLGEALDWFCAIETITTTTITCRTPKINDFYTPGTAYKFITSTRLVVFSTCPANNCEFTYQPLSASPNITAISAANTNVGTITITGTNLIDSNSFAEVVLYNALDNATTVLPSSASTATSVSFQVTANVIAGKYNVQVRNLVGQSNPIPMSVNLSPGTVSWASGGSRAGGIISINNGAGFPAKLDGTLFAVTITSGGGIVHPVKVVSCCAGNSISLEVP